MRHWLNRGPEGDLSRLPISLDLRAISVAEGLRAALAVAAIVAADQFLQWPPLLEAALGALLTCLGDAGGPMRRRLPALLVFTAIGAAFTAGFGLARSAGLGIALPLACLGIFATSFARAWGQSPLQIGNLLTVVLVLALDRPVDGPAALVLASVFAAGCLWATLLTMVIWRVHPFRPSRRAIANAYYAIGQLSADLRTLIRHDALAAEWDMHARGHRRAVHDAIEKARVAVLDTLRTRGAMTPRATQALVRVEAADQLFSALIALSDLLEANREPALRDAADHLLRLLRPVLEVFATAIVADDPGAMGNAVSIERVGHIGGSLNKITAAGAGTAIAAISNAIVERLRVAATVTAPDGVAPGELPRDAAKLPLRGRIFGPLRANLTWQSASLRHAVRAAVVAAPALAFTLTWHGSYQHWLTITLILTMQPFYALTWQRALERIGGTVLGGIAAALIALVCNTPIAIAAAMFPLAVLAFAMRAVSFGAFIACMTPLVVLLTEFSRPGEGQVAIAIARAAYTAAGGVLAVAGCILLWPSWEPDRLRIELRAAIMAHAAFAEAELDALLGIASANAVDQVRRAAGVASNNLEASLSRALHEPRRSLRAGLESVLLIDAALRRMAGRLSALQLDPHYADGVPAPVLQLWRDWIGRSLRAIADGAALPDARPDGRVPDPLARIARQIELMDGAMQRGRGAPMAASQPPSPPLARAASGRVAS